MLLKSFATLFLGLALLAASVLLPLPADQKSCLLAASIAFCGWPTLRAASMAVLARRVDASLLIALTVVGLLAVGKVPETALFVSIIAACALGQDIAWQRKLTLLYREWEVLPSAASAGGEIKLTAGDVASADLIVRSGGADIRLSPLASAVLPAQATENSLIFAGSRLNTGEITAEILRAPEPLGRRILLIIRQAAAEREQTANIDYSLNYARRLLTFIFCMAVPYFFFAPSMLQWLYYTLALLLIFAPYNAAVKISSCLLAMTLDRAARHGIITRRPAAIEEASSIQSVAFDKEATLTTGRLILSNIFAPYPFSRPELMRVAAALTKEAGHPLAAAIAGQAPDEAGGSPSVQVLSSHELNISGTVDGRETVMGSNAFLTGLGIKTHTFLRKYSEYLSHGSLVLFVAVGGETVGLLSFIDDMRPETFSTIKTIKSINQGKIVMLTPEEERAANSASRPLGFTQALSKISRAAKAVTVKKLHHRHGGVLFVGNDQTEEAVFANADISVAADVRKDPWNALKKADIVMLGEGLNSLSELFRLSSKYRKGVKTAKRLLFLGKLAIFAAVIFNFIYLWQGLILDGLWGFILVTAARSLLR